MKKKRIYTGLLSLSEIVELFISISNQVAANPTAWLFDTDQMYIPDKRTSRLLGQVDCVPAPTVSERLDLLFKEVLWPAILSEIEDSTKRDEIKEKLKPVGIRGDELFILLVSEEDPADLKVLSAALGKSASKVFKSSLRLKLAKKPNR